MEKLFFVIIFIVISGSVTGCGFFSDADEKFYFGEKIEPDKLEYQYRALANELHSIKPCYLIHSQSLSRGGFGSVGNQVSLLRSQCFAVVGEALGDERICDKVRSASTLFLSGANLNADLCRQKARLNRESSIRGSSSYRLDLPEIVSLAGYDLDEIDTFLVSEERFSGMEAAMDYRQNMPETYWGEVSRTLLHSEDFFDRITNLPGFGTSGDRANMNALRWETRQQRQWVAPEQRTQTVPEIRIPAQPEQQ